MQLTVRRTPLHAILLVVLGSLVVGCTHTDQAAAGEKTQMSEQQKGDPNAVNESGNPIIFDAIEKSDFAQVKRLVEAGADIEKRGFGEQTSALWAASGQGWDICLYLLNRGADAKIADDSGLTIPYLAFNSRILPSSYEGQYLAKVKEFLIQRHLDALNIPPKRVRELMASGAWPPGAAPGK